MNEINILNIDEKCITYEQCSEEESTQGCLFWPEDLEYDDE